MLLDASGNLGLGVTPSAWLSNFRVLQIGNSNSTAFLYGRSDSTIETSWGSNAFYSSSTSDWRYSNNGFASNLLQINGQFRWFTAPSGTAGNAISFTQAMTLNASGNLSLGITDATGNANRILHINGADSAELHLTRSNSGSSSSFGGYVTFDGSNNFNLQNRTGGSVNLITGTTTALSIASTGAATFSNNVTANGIIYSRAANYPQIVFQETTSSTDALIFYDNAAATKNLGFRVNSASNVMTLTSTNVGINTTTPGGIFQVDVTNGTTDIIRLNRPGVRQFGIIMTNGDFNLVDNTAAVTRFIINTSGNAEFSGSIKTGEPGTGWGRAAIKIGAREDGTAFNGGSYLPISIDGTIYYINLFSSTP